MTKILMVCLGNICRSPLAEGILRSKVNLDKVLVDSAGTAAYHLGNLPDKRSIKVANKHGLDIRYQRARQFTQNDFDAFNVIYVMDKSNYEDVMIKARNSEDKKKVKMILNESLPNLNKSVPDPYYGGEDGFEKVYQILDKACQIIASKY